jgi:Family of unknown function (DUF6600)
MNTRRMGWTKWLIVLGTLVLVIPQMVAAQDDSDPPGRVARLSYTNGAVSFSPAGTDDWAAAVVNRPVTTGDKLWADKDSRAELGLGTAYIRLNSETGFSLLNLDDSTTQIRLTEGTINVYVKRLDQNEIFEVDTPNVAFTATQPGSYNINVNENGDATLVDVREGEGEVTGGGSVYTVHAGESGMFSGTDQISADVENRPGDDDFEQWCADRDYRIDNSLSARYVSDDVVGYQDLDEYGGWRPVPDYGYVWFPHTTVVGWAPYRYGHWVWVAPWGWTWVDDAPWGFAPFHYGRWIFVGGAWGWVPCRPRPRGVTGVYVRPVYAPALVAWVGAPHGGFGRESAREGAGVAWFPLGPRDVYLPSYHVSRRYVENVNVSNTVVINRTYVTREYDNVYVNRSENEGRFRYQNQAVAGSVTATSRTTFLTAQPVGRNIIRVNEREMASARVAPGGPAVVPEQRSVLGGEAQARFRPPARVVSRQVVVKTAPPPEHVSFDRQRQAIQANGGRPLSNNEERNLRPANQPPHDNVRFAPEARPATPQFTGAGHPNVHPVQAPVQNSVDRGRPNLNDRPPASGPVGVQRVDPQIQQRHQQQTDELRKQQDAERQKLEQQQIQERQRMNQQNANEQRQEQLRQHQQQQLQQMERQHNDQAQRLQQRQVKEVHQSQKESRPPKESKGNKPSPNHH